MRNDIITIMENEGKISQTKNFIRNEVEFFKDPEVRLITGNLAQKTGRLQARLAFESTATAIAIEVISNRNTEYFEKMSHVTFFAGITLVISGGIIKRKAQKHLAETKLQI